MQPLSSSSLWVYSLGCSSPLEWLGSLAGRGERRDGACVILAEASSPLTFSPGIAIAVATISAVAAVGAAWVSRRRPKDTVWKASEEIRREQREEIISLRSRVEELQEDNDSKDRTISGLRRRLERVGEGTRDERRA